MPSETKELKVKVSLTSEGKIVIIAEHKEFQKYAITNGQKGKSPLASTLCMLGDKLLRIQINNDSLLEVKSVSTINGDADWEEEKEVEKIKKLFGLCEAEEEKEIEIFKNFAPKVQKLANEKRELQNQLTEANKEKTALEEQLQKKGEELEDANKKAENDKTELQTQLAEAEENKNKALEDAKKQAEEKIAGLQNQLDTAKAANPNAAALQQQLADKDKEIKDLEAQLNNRPDAAALQQQLADKEKEIAQLKQQQPNAEVEKLKNDLKTKTSQVQQLTQKNKELEAKNKTTEQPKQGNGAKYTATVGMGLAAGLVAFTALERTVRLEMLVMIGIAVASALVAGGITYAVLPSTQVNGAEAQGVSGDEKSK